MVGREQDRERYVGGKVQKKAAGRGFRMTMESSCNCDRDRGGGESDGESVGGGRT